MERLIEILEEIDMTIDYEKEEKLINDGILDSMSILSLVSELEEAFDIDISPADLVPENFNSAKAMWEMVNGLKGE